MLRFLAILLFVILFVSLETSVLPLFSVFGVTPDILLILVVVWGIIRGGREAAILGFAVGLTQDILSSSLYYHAFSKCLIGFGSGVFSRNLSGASSYMSIVMVSIMTIVSYLIEGVLLYFFLGHPVPQFPRLFLIVLISVLYNGLLTPIIHPIVELFSLRIGSPQREESFSELT